MLQAPYCAERLLMPFPLGEMKGLASPDMKDVGIAMTDGVVACFSRHKKYRDRNDDNAYLIIVTVPMNSSDSGFSLQVATM